MNKWALLPVAAVLVTAAGVAGAPGCASEENGCESADAGTADAGEPDCPEEDVDVQREADEALEPMHVIDHIGDMLP